jgi:LacI family transcriptional regulator
MKDIARIAGVTQPTVSHVINGTASISKEVCDRVNRVIREVNYRPNALAKGLKTNKTNIVGLIVPDVGNGFYAMLARNVEGRLVKEGYAVFLACTGYDQAMEANYLDNLLQYNVEGIIIAYQLTNRASIDKLIRMNKPFVTLDDELWTNPENSVRINHFEGGYVATRHLLKSGRKKVVFVSEPLSMEAIKERLAGYKKAHEEMDVLLEKSRVVTAHGVYDKFKMGYELGRRIVEKDPDGIFAASDVIAFGVMRALVEAGKRVPEDIALIGYDDVPMAKVATPALSTVAQPVDKMVEIGVDKLVAMMEGEPKKGESNLKPKLIIRETT